MTVLVLTLALAGPAYREKPVKIPNGDRPELAANIGIPESTRRVPCVVIGPGAGYHKDKMLIKDLGSELRSSGVATVRFDWAFFTAQAEPSKDYAGEIRDMQAAIRFARAQPLIDPDRVWVAGKSLGSIVAWKVFAADAKLSGALLFTPIARVAEPGQWYPGLAAEKRPVLFSVPDADPDGCPLNALHLLTNGAGANVRVQIHPGNHGFEVAKPTDLTPDKTNGANIAVVVRSAVRLFESWTQ
ncbi:MAG: dienelactone hydrolase family protein [Chthonomonas sp.]|nr:dienelactone hydrolase family protein [Chthonomonas sp.]